MAYDAKAHGALCGACPLAEANAVVPPAPARGRPHLVILGEGPGRVEVMRKVPFSGPSGALLNEVLQEADVRREDVHITNVTLCPYEGDEKHLAAAITCCAPRLAAELAALPSEAPVVPLGKTALKVATGAASILNARGFVYTAPGVDARKRAAAAKSLEKARASLAAKAADKLAKHKTASKRKRAALSFSVARLRERVTKLSLTASCLDVRASIAGRTVIPSVHPAFILRGADGWRPILAVDVARAARAAVMQQQGGGLELLDEMPYKVASNAKQLKRLAAKLKRVVAVDIETDSVDPLTCDIKCVGISDASPETPPSSWTTIVAYPWKKTMARVLTKTLARRTAITHNGHAFDMLALERFAVDVPHVDDTLLAHHTYASHLPQRLGHVATVFCDVGPWKTKHKGTASIEEKGASPWEKGGEELVKYNAADARVQAYVWHAMAGDLASERDVYEKDKQAAIICQQMQRNGIRVDVERRKQLSMSMKGRAAALLGEMRKTVKSSYFNPKRPEDIRAALFGRFRASPTSYTATGLRSTAAGVLEALRGNDTRAGRLADGILRWRSAAKSRATFLGGLRTGLDGRVHPSWRAFGTVTGRWACRAPNLMNLPRYAEQECVICRATWKAGVERCSARVPGGGRCGGSLRPSWENMIRSIYIASPGNKLVYFDLCFAEGTLVDGPIGAKPIESMLVGDLVYTYRASTRKPAVGRVNEVISVGRAPVVKVTLDNGEEVRCTPDHKWLVCPQFQKDDPVERRAEDLRLGDRLLPLRKVINRGSWRHPAAPREYLYAHDAAHSSQTHVEVARTVLGERPPGHDTHHVDGNAMNNAPGNLEYKLSSDHHAEHGRETALRSWKNPAVRATRHEAMRQNGEKWRRDGRFAGENNPRYGDRRGRVTLTCAQCGGQYEAWRRDKDESRFCSRRCYLASKAVKSQCLFCGGTTKQSRTKFCSRACWREGLKAGLNHRVVSVEDDGYANVWSIGVDPDHNYALAAGVFVRNCQSEMRAAAYISGDDRFIATCESGDVHAGNASILFPEAAELFKTDPKNPACKELRDITKNAGFGILYLAEVLTIYNFLIAHGFDVELDQVEAMFDHIRWAYRGYYRYVDDNIQKVKEDGYLRTALSGRIRWLGWYAKPTEVANFMVQSFIADLMNMRLTELMLTRGKLPSDVKLVAQIHDAVIFDVPERRVDDVCGILKEVWAKPVDIPTNGRTMVMPIDMKVGERWSDF